MALIDHYHSSNFHLSDILSRASRAYARWRELERERHLVSVMTERDIRDLGLTRSQLEFELDQVRLWQG